MVGPKAAGGALQVPAMESGLQSSRNPATVRPSAMGMSARVMSPGSGVGAGTGAVTVHPNAGARRRRTSAIARSPRGESRPARLATSCRAATVARSISAGRASASHPESSSSASRASRQRSTADSTRSAACGLGEPARTSSSASQCGSGSPMPSTAEPAASKRSFSARTSARRLSSWARSGEPGLASRKRRKASGSQLSMRPVAVVWCSSAFRRASAALRARARIALTMGRQSSTTAGCSSRLGSPPWLP